MVRITLKPSPLQRLCICSLVTASCSAILSLDSAAEIQLLLALVLCVQLAVVFYRQLSISSSCSLREFVRTLLFPVASCQLMLGAHFCSFDYERCRRRFQQPEVLYFSEWLIILQFSPLLDKEAPGLRSSLRRWLGKRCILITPDSLVTEHDWILRRHLYTLCRE